MKSMSLCSSFASLLLLAGCSSEAPGGSPQATDVPTMDAGRDDVQPDRSPPPSPIADDAAVIQDSGDADSGLAADAPGDTNTDDAYRGFACLNKEYTHAPRQMIPNYPFAKGSCTEQELLIPQACYDGTPCFPSTYKDRLSKSCLACLFGDGPPTRGGVFLPPYTDGPTCLGHFNVFGCYEYLLPGEGQARHDAAKCEQAACDACADHDAFMECLYVASRTVCWEQASRTRGIAFELIPCEDASKDGGKAALHIARLFCGPVDASPDASAP